METGWFPKIGAVFTPKMDGENFHGKIEKFPMNKWMIWEKNLVYHLFLVQHPNEGC